MSRWGFQIRDHSGQYASLAPAGALVLALTFGAPGIALGQAPFDGPTVLATIGSEQVTFSDIKPATEEELAKLEVQYLRARSKVIETALHAALRDRLFRAEGQKAGKSVDELLAAEAGPAGFEPLEREITAWYGENSSRLSGRTVEQVRPQIVAFLRQRKQRDAADRLETRLMRERGARVTFEPYRVTLNNTGAPTLGPPNAPVTLVEFSDFQCPACRSFAPTLKRVAKEFGNSVQIVYRQLPIPSIHRFAIKAAEASLCANEQGKFWELHDLMFSEQDRLDEADLKDKAERVGMDHARFDSCLSGSPYLRQVQDDMLEAARIGVAGTPAVFINGVMIEGGAVPYETLAAAIQKELNRTGKE